MVIFGHFLEKFALLLFQHLVTLNTTASRLPFESVKCVKVGTWMVAVDFSWIGSGMELFGRGLGKVVSAQLVSYCVCDKPP